jgi:anti-sigma factor RsiW
MNGHPQELLSAYADGELAPAEALRVEEHLATCTECARELAINRTLGGAMRSTETDRPGGGIWEGVHRRITQPVGWMLILSGVAVWVGLAVVAWFREAMTWEWLLVTAMGVGFLLLLVGIGHEQYREWKTSPYKDIER